MKSSRKLLKFLSEKKESISPLLILTHNYPDPDAIASAFALQYLAENFFSVKTKIAYGGIIGRMENRSMVDILEIPISKLRSSDFKEYSYYALVDTQPLFQNNSFPEDKNATIVIDQHPCIEKPKADLVLIDIKCGATCVIIAEALLATNTEIPKNIATALTYGIISETLDLYRGATKRVIKTYLQVLPRSDISILAQIQNPSRSKNFFKTLGIGIQNAIICENLISSHLGFVENPDLVSQTADFFLSYESAEWSMCSGRYKENLHVSLRSKATDSTAGTILREVVGDSTKAGGHGGIAGGTVEVGADSDEEKWKLAEEAISQKLIEKLGITPKSCSNFPFKVSIEKN